ncbi:unnamed protein product, partial [Urochloa humidicola]
KGMPNPAVIGGNCFEHDSGHLMVTACKLTLPCNWTESPMPVHTIETPQHSRKPTRLSNLKRSCRKKKFTEEAVGREAIQIEDVGVGE